MRVVQIKRSRVVKFLLIGLTLFAGLIFILKSFNKDLENNFLSQNNFPEVFSGNQARHISHPKEVPVFKGRGIKGNFEPDTYGGGSEPGDEGRPVKLKFEDKSEEERLKNVYGFNQLVSDRISLNRTVPDTREEECKFWDYPTNLPSASVILVFHNEGWSSLLRTVNSIINRSPPQFLHQIVLVDDKSELEHLQEPLEQEMKKPYYSKVLIVRNKEREGLIRARNNGAIAATGDVVVFLDAHCEVDYNWLPPLLAPIHEDRTTLSVPVIDGIKWDDFSITPVYAAGAHSRGLFEWGMFYKEGQLPDQEQKRNTYHSQPYRAPTHAGGLFAIDREWFKQLGWYDPGLWVWGGENFELSFKVWMCGGRSVWVPCSRVAHVYRGHSCSSCHSGSLSNKFQGVPTTLRNYKRVIETWFDDQYKEYFYTREPLARFIDMGDISQQLQLKKDMNCKSFDWFMKEIAYDVLEKYPPLPPNKKWGEMKNEANQLCFDTFGRHPPELAGASGCHGFGGNQLLRLNTEGQLTSGEWCIKADKGGKVSVSWCVMSSTSGPWQYKDDTHQMYNDQMNKCLAIHPESQTLLMSECNDNDLFQKWAWKEIKPYWAKKQ